MTRPVEWGPNTNVPLPQVPATDGQVYGYDAALGTTRAFNQTGVQTWRAVNISGVATAFSNAVGTPVTLVLPASVAVPVNVGAICSVTATSAITNLSITILEVTNGVDPLVSAKFLIPALASGSSETLIIPETALYIPPTGRQRTLNVNIVTSTGGGNVINTPTTTGGANGFPTIIQARSAS